MTIAAKKMRTIQPMSKARRTLRGRPAPRALLMMDIGPPLSRLRPRRGSALPQLRVRDQAVLQPIRLEPQVTLGAPACTPLLVQRHGARDQRAEDQRERCDHHAIDQPAGRTEPPDCSSSRERDSTLLVTEPAAAELPASMVVTRRDVEVAGLDAPVAAAEVAPR